MEEELLQKWANLVPDECYFYTDFVRLYLTEEVQFEIPLFELQDNKVNASILWFTIQAIEARGWDWRIAYVKPDAWFASVYTTPSYEPEVGVKSDKSSAYALLSANLQAIQGVG